MLPSTLSFLRRNWLGLGIAAAVVIVGGGLVWLQLQFGNPSRRPASLNQLFVFGNKCADLPEDKVQEYHDRFDTAKKRLEANADDFNAWYAAGLMKKFVCDYAGARDIWEYANSIRPKNSIAFAALGNLYGYFLKDFEKAEVNYLKAIENEEAFKKLQAENKAPEYAVNTEYYRNLYELYRAKGAAKDAQALGILLRGLKVEPKEANLTVVLASHYRDTGRIPEAIEWFEASLKIVPDNKAVQDELTRLKAKAS